MTDAPSATSDVGNLPSAHPIGPIRIDPSLWHSPTFDAPDLTTGNVRRRRETRSTLRKGKGEKGEVQPSRDREPPRRCDACTADTLQGGAPSGPSRAAGTLQRFESGVG